MAQQLLFVRHAIAQEWEDFSRTGQNDDQRPLTEEGFDRFVETAQGLRQIFPDITEIFCSPLVRAQQTAAILANIFEKEEVVEIDALAPGADFDELLGELNQQNDDDIIALVGHEPDLSEAVCRFLGGTGPAPFMHLKKGQCCLLRFAGELAAGQGTLLWSLTPGQLRKLT